MMGRGAGQTWCWPVRGVTSSPGPSVSSSSKPGASGPPSDTSLGGKLRQLPGEVHTQPDLVQGRTGFPPRSGVRRGTDAAHGLSASALNFISSLAFTQLCAPQCKMLRPE